MIRKTHASGWALVTVLVSLIAVGCGPSETELKMQDLSAENDQLKTDVGERDRQLNDALVRENDARDSIDELNREMATLRNERDQRLDTGDWISTPTVDMISISDSVLFASGRASLSTTGRARLAQIATDIRSRYADRDIYVFGHTDDQPIRKSKWKDNWELGAQRSLTVVRTLAGQGISRNQLIVASCGEYRPLTMGAAKGNQPRNRRVEVMAVLRNAPSMDKTAARAYQD